MCLFRKISGSHILKIRLLAILVALSIACFNHAAAAEKGEVLYNGIVLPASWPPQLEPTREPMSPPYLTAPPEVIPINIGRQLFVDDFLIEKTDLIRTHHTPVPYEGNPVVRPNRPWELDAGGSYAMAFSDGVWYDEADKLFKMWYYAGSDRVTCYAISKDGLHWTKPELDVHPGTNIVCEDGRDSGIIWLDLNATERHQRYKMFLYNFAHDQKFTIHYSVDGIHWGKPVGTTGPVGDRTTVFYNPFRKVWVYSVRGYTKELGRLRQYSEGPDPISAGKWEKPNDPAFWIGADNLDLPYPGIDVPPQLYNLDVAAYESLFIGLFAVWKGPENQDRIDRDKRNELYIGYSRDGFHWSRPLRRPFIGVSETSSDWNYANIQSVGGCCLVVGDKLYFYHSGRRGFDKSMNTSGVGSTGLALLRRDGFVSMDGGESGGTLTTRLLDFSGKYLFVNLDTHAGELRVEALDRNNSVIPPFSKENSEPVSLDKTRCRVAWKDAKDLSAVDKTAVKFRFHLRNGSLYSFWMCPDESGASFGYIAAGGPGLIGPTDTQGMEAYPQ